jgi:DNA-binding NtrC family response regulator
VGEKPFRDLVDDAEREIILRTLAFTRDNATEAARLLDLERGHFYKKMKALGIRRPRAQTPEAQGGETSPDDGTGSSEAG